MGGREVEIRWHAGLGSSPCAVDLRTTGPDGPIAKAVALPEALMISAVIDTLCPGGASVYETVRQLPTQPPTGQCRP